LQRLQGVTKGKMVLGNKRAKLKPRIEVAPKRKVVRDTSGIKRRTEPNYFAPVNSIRRRSLQLSGSAVE
jgi:hypothetical protein